MRRRLDSCTTPPARLQAVLSINAIVAVLSDSDARAHAWPLVERLVGRDWFTARTSACGVLPRVLARLPLEAGGAKQLPQPGTASSKMEVDAGAEAGAAGAAASAAAAAAATRGDAFSLFFRLANDDTPMVRRAACLAFSDVATALAGGRIGGAGSAPGERMDEDDEAGARPGHHQHTAGGGAGGVAAAGDGYNVDTGDVSNSAVPPPVPPAVRVASASPVAGDAAARQLLPLLLDTFSRDEQDSVRLLAMDVATALTKLLPHGPPPGAEPSGAQGAAAASALPAGLLASAGGVRDSLLGVVTSLASDKSWRVRWSVANRFSEFSHAIVLGNGGALPQPMVAGSAAVASAAGCVPASRLLPLFERLLAVSARARVVVAFGGGGGGFLADFVVLRPP